MVRRLFWEQEKVGSIPATSTVRRCPMARLVSRLACRASEAGSKPAWGAIRPRRGGKRASKTREGWVRILPVVPWGRAEGCRLALQAGFLGALPSDSTNAPLAQWQSTRMVRERRRLESGMGLHFARLVYWLHGWLPTSRRRLDSVNAHLQQRPKCVGSSRPRCFGSMPPCQGGRASSILAGRTRQSFM